MKYKDIIFNIISWQDAQDYFPWKLKTKLFKKFCEQIKSKYGLEWSYGQGDGLDSFFSFYYEDKRLIDENIRNEIRKKIKTLGTIISEMTYSHTMYNHSILKIHEPDPKKYPTWYHKQLFVDRNKGQYKKHFGCKWYIGSYTNNENITKQFTFSYLENMELWKYKQ